MIMAAPRPSSSVQSEHFFLPLTLSMRSPLLLRALGALALVLLSLASSASADATWKSCGVSTDLVQKLEVAFPDQPRKGKDFSIKVDGELAKIVGDGQVAITVTLYGAPLYRETKKMCSGSDKCHFEPGHLTYNEKVSMPGLCLADPMPSIWSSRITPMRIMPASPASTSTSCWPSPATPTTVAPSCPTLSTRVLESS